jgi:parallel beta-helix repeat protein
MTRLPFRRLCVLMLALGCSGGGAKSLDAGGLGGAGDTGGTLGGYGGSEAAGGMPGSGGAAPMGGSGPALGTGGTFLDGGAVGPGVDAGPLGSKVGSLELYGTFHAMGVIATLPAGSDSNANAVANLDYRMTGAADYAAGFPLTRTGASTFIGSLFWLAPGTSYDVRVRYSDPDGGALDKGFATATASTRAEIAIPSPTRTLVAAPTGTGSACSTAAPCGLSQALGQAQAGDEVSLTAGIYNAGGLTISRTGTAAAPIVIRGQTGAILDGADPGTFTWTAGSNGVFTTKVNAADPHMVASNGARLYPYADAASLASLSASNTPGFFANGTSLSVHLAGGANPSTTTMAISRQNFALTINGSFVYVIGLTFRYYGLAEYAKAIYIRDGSNNLVQGCRFITNDLGIGLKGTADRNVIQDNEFSDTIAGWTWEDVKAEGNLETGGVRFYDPVDGRGTVIRRNKFHDFFDGLGICPGSSAAASNETDFYDNESYNLGDDGVETDGQCVNVRLWGNRFHDSLSGISLAPVIGGPVYCLRNQIYMTGAGTSQAGYTGLPFKFNSGDGDSGAIYVIHNTVDAQRAGNDGFRIMSPGTWTKLYARNNVFAGTLHALENANPSQPVDMDYDDLWRSGSDYLCRWDGLANPRLATLADYTAATGQERHGLDQAPAFVAPATPDFTPAPGSPLIDHGVYLPGINDGFRGQAPDLGAIEAQ